MGLIESIENFKLSKKFKYFYFGMLCVLFPLVITIYGIVYFGGLWDPISRLKNLEVAIINKDVGCPAQTNILCTILASRGISGINIGETIVQSIEANEQTKNIFKWMKDDVEEQEAIKMVEDYDRWGVIYIPQNFTQNILSNIDTSAYASPEAQQALIKSLCEALKLTPEQLAKAFDLTKLGQTVDATINYIYDTSRSYTSVTFMTTVFETIDKTIKKSVALSMYQKAVAPGMATFNNKFYMNAYVSNYQDIHPLRNFGQNFATFMLFVIVYIAAIATTLVYRKYRPFNNYIQDKKTNTSIFTSILGKFGINIIYMLVATAFMMLVMFMFGDAQHEKNMFCAYLIFVLWSFIGLAFCHLISNLLPLLPFIGISVIFIVIQLATCGGILALPLQPGFWSIGKAFPMYYATAEMKYLMFNTGSRFSGRNILALCLWAVGLVICDLLTSIITLRNVRKQAPQANNDLEKQAMKSANERVTQDDIAKGNGDITNME